jgi:hypothetical protein
MNTEKTSLEAQNQPSCLGAVSGCCSLLASDNISKVYLLDPKDCVFENGIMIRMKRKYGKFKRVVHVIDYNNR